MRIVKRRNKDKIPEKIVRRPKVRIFYKFGENSTIVMEVTITISVSKARLERGMEEKHLMMSDKLSLYKEIVNEMETSDKKAIVNCFMYMLYIFFVI